MRTARQLPLVVFFILVACSPDSGGGGECVSTADCAPGESCIDSRCVSVDAGPPPEDAGGCPPGRTLCGGSCVDTSTSGAHCGGCDVACDAMESCIGGSCLPDCAEHETRCGSDCVDTQTDAAHCGGCANACDEGLMCEAGECITPCTPTEPPVEVCDGVDNDCDGEVDPGCGGGLLAWYRFEETEGMVTDASGNGLHGAVAGGVSRGVDGRSGAGIHFDGADGTRVSVAEDPVLTFTGAMTVEAWIFPVDCSHGSSGQNTVVAKEGELLLAFDNTCRVANYVNVGGSWTGDLPGTLIVPGEWTHLAMTYDGATIQSYVDGNPAGSGTALTGDVTDGTAVLYIGERPDCCSQTFHGRVDEVKLWNVARTPREICEDAGLIWLDDSESCRR